MLDSGKQLADNAVVFTVSTNAAGSYDYDVISIKNIDKDENIAPKTGTPAGNYALNSNGDRVVAMIIDNGASGGTNSYGFVDSASKVSNKKGDTVRKVDAFIDGKEVTALTDTNGAYAAIDGSGHVVSDQLMRFEFNGDVITNIVAMNHFLDYDQYPSDSITKDIVKIYDNGDWQKVYDTNNNALKVSNAVTGKEADAGFITVKGAKAYRAVMGDDGSGFDHWALGDVSNISTGAYVAMFQVNKNNSAPDVVVYVTKSDITKTAKDADGQPDLQLDFHSGNVAHSNSNTASLITNGKTQELNDKISVVKDTIFDPKDKDVAADSRSHADIALAKTDVTDKYTVTVTPGAIQGESVDITLAADGATFTKDNVPNTGSITFSEPYNASPAKVEVTVNGKNPQITATLEKFVRCDYSFAAGKWQDSVGKHNVTAKVVQQGTNTDATDDTDSTYTFNEGVADQTIKVHLAGTAADKGMYPVQLKVGNEVIAEGTSAMLNVGGVPNNTFVTLTLKEPAVATSNIEVKVGEPVQEFKVSSSADLELMSGVKVSVKAQSFQAAAGGTINLVVTYSNTNIQAQEGTVYLKGSGGMAPITVQLTGLQHTDGTATNEVTVPAKLPADFAESTMAPLTLALTQN